MLVFHFGKRATVSVFVSSRQRVCLQGLARPVPRYAVTVIYKNQQCMKQKIFSVFRKKSKAINKTFNDEFRKVVISN